MELCGSWIAFNSVNTTSCHSILSSHSNSFQNWTYELVHPSPQIWSLNSHLENREDMRTASPQISAGTLTASRRRQSSSTSPLWRRQWTGSWSDYGRNARTSASQTTWRWGHLWMHSVRVGGDLIVCLCGQVLRWLTQNALFCPQEMTQRQMALEKITLQKCLLYFESLHGRPVRGF